MESAQASEYTIVGTGLHSDGSSYNVLEAHFAPTDKRLDGSKWAECALCGWVDRQSAMASVGGRFYCNKNGCAQEKSDTSNSKH